MLPKHDEIGVARRILAVASLATAAGLLGWNLLRVGTASIALPWWLVIVAIAGMFAADFLSGLIHWAADTWGSESMPVIGRRLLHPFRVHHVNPDDFLRRRFIDTNGDVAMIIVPVSAAGLLIPLDGPVGLSAVVFLCAFCGVGFLTNQIHQWAHMPHPPIAIQVLQKSRFILSREAHARHHQPPYTANYFIATGWCNQPFAAIGFFRRLERLIIQFTGLQPRQDEVSFQVHISNHSLAIRDYVEEPDATG